MSKYNKTSDPMASRYRHAPLHRQPIYAKDAAADAVSARRNGRSRPKRANKRANKKANKRANMTKSAETVHFQRSGALAPSALAGADP